MIDTYNLTKDHEFSDKQLKAFHSILKKKHISKTDLENSEIMQMLVEQSGSKSFDKYLSKDQKLHSQIFKQ